MERIHDAIESLAEIVRDVEDEEELLFAVHRFTRTLRQFDFAVGRLDALDDQITAFEFGCCTGRPATVEGCDYLEGELTDIVEHVRGTAIEARVRRMLERVASHRAAIPGVTRRRRRLP
jgi:hypothetical protein